MPENSDDSFNDDVYINDLMNSPSPSLSSRSPPSSSAQSCLQSRKINLIVDDDDDDDDELALKFRKGKRTAGKLIDQSDDDDNDTQEGGEFSTVTKDNTSIHFNVSEETVPPPLTPHHINDLEEEMWVMVRFEDPRLQNRNSEFFIGKVLKVYTDPAGANVRCLERQFGIGEPQKLEKCWKWYSVDNIFVSPVIPKTVTARNVSKWTYQYES